MSKPWWSDNWGNDKICGITHSRLRPGKNTKGVYYTTRLKCNHRFCTYPLLEWIKKCPKEIPTCPICRGSFDLQDLFLG
jgi:hypothetical protein